MLLEEKERELGITPDPAVAAYMRAMVRRELPSSALSNACVARAMDAPCRALCMPAAAAHAVCCPRVLCRPPTCHAQAEHHRLATDIAIRALGLEGCADTLVVRRVA